MSNNNFFQQQLAIGKSGEQIVKQFLINRGHNVTDVSNNAAYFKKDIDFIITDTLGFQYFVEVKTDYKLHKSGNLFFESTYHKSWGDTSGWYDYCEADYIAFLDAVEMKLYIYDFRRGKEYVKKNAEYREFYNYDDACYREAYLLPIDRAKQAGLIQEFDLSK